MAVYWVLLVLLVLDVVLVTPFPTPVNNYQVLAGHQVCIDLWKEKDMI